MLISAFYSDCPAQQTREQGFETDRQKRDSDMAQAASRRMSACSARGAGNKSVRG